MGLGVREERESMLILFLRYQSSSIMYEILKLLKQRILVIVALYLVGSGWK